MLASLRQRGQLIAWKANKQKKFAMLLNSFYLGGGAERVALTLETAKISVREAPGNVKL